MRDAIRLGAVCRNYTPVVGLARHGDAWWVRLSNARAASSEASIEAKVVINTAGIWIDRVNRLATGSAGTVVSHRTAGRELLAAVRSRLSPSGSPHAPNYATHLAPGREGSPALLNDDDGVRIADLRYAAECTRPRAGGVASHCRRSTGRRR